MIKARSTSLNAHRLARGFTFFEVLIASAILAVLVAVIVPTLGKAHDRGKEVQCLSNLRQIGVAVQLYGADFQVYVPFTTAGSDWSYLIKPYLDRSGQVVYSDPNERSPVVICPSRSVTPPNLQPSYSPHRQIMAVNGQSTVRRYGSIRRPCNVVLMADSIQSAAVALPQGGWGCYALAFQMPYSWTLGGTPATAESAVPTWPDADGDGDNVRYRHHGRANFLFVDGHVVSMKKGELKEKHVMLSY